jgi:hypothetical protein
VGFGVRGYGDLDRNGNIGGSLTLCSAFWKLRLMNSKSVKFASASMSRTRFVAVEATLP